MMRRHDDETGDGQRLNPVDLWAARHGKTIIAGVVYTLTAWYALKAQVNSKVDNSVFTQYVVHADSVQSLMLGELRELRAGQRETHDYLCRGKENQIGCQSKP